jgi:heme-degrading monooxygenase HmoA
MDAMFIRTTRYQVKKSSMARFQELTEFARDRAAKLDGLLQNFVGMDEAGNAVMVGVWETREKFQASLEVVKANWAEVMEHVEGQLQVDEYPTAFQVKGG